MSKDYYSTLGLSRDASEADIKKSYRELSKKWHPDKHKGDKDAEAKFKEINEAYEVLGNAKKKQQYDQFGSTGGPGGAGFGGFDFSGFQQGDMGGLGDIFESFFGGGGGGARGQRRGRNRGGDLQVRISIAFAEVLSGVKKTIAIEKFVSCAECKGTGSEGGNTKQCSDCGGTGQITRTAQSFFGTIQQAVACDACNGSGSIPEHPCKKCGSEGRRREKTQLTVDVPPGIDHGQTLRVTGQGDAGKEGAEAGDLFVVVMVEPDARFVRDGSDIRTEVSISVLDAMLGTDITVPTVHGDTKLKIPAGTQPATVMRIKAKGFPVLSSSRLGDQYVTVNVTVPKKLSRKEKELMEEWRKL